MGKFTKKKRHLQDIPTSTLSDITIALLFFFMVVSKPSPKEPKVNMEFATATEVQTIPESMEEIILNVGVPKNSFYGTEPVIQAGEKFIPVSSVRDFVSSEISKLPPAKRGNMSLIMINLKADKTVKMGMITDIKEQLRAMNILNISYATDVEKMN